MNVKDLRKYGREPYSVAVIHGGPGAPGVVAPVARKLSQICGVLEPLQTANTLEGQIQELKNVLEKNGAIPITLIGHSWGGMLSFIFTGRYPRLVRKLVLIGSGPFEEKYAINIEGTRLGRLSEEERVEALSLADILDDPNIEDKNTPMGKLASLWAKADSYDPVPHDNEMLEFRYDINQNVWREAKKLRSSGELLKIGKSIKCPVLAIHGDYDSHLPEGVKDPLVRVLEQFRFILLEKCGHEPWIEKSARDRFYDILKKEIQKIGNME